MTTPLNARDLLLQNAINRFEDTPLDILRNQSNRIFAQRVEPFSTIDYTLRTNDTWIDQGSKNYATFTSEFSAANGYSIGTTSAGNMSTTLLNQIAGPLPYLTGSTLVADRFVENTNTAGRYISKAVNWSIVGLGIHTISIYIKAAPGALRYFELVVLAAVAGTNKFTSFDIVNGVVINSTSGVVNAACASVGNGWFRCSMAVDILVANNSTAQLRLSDVSTSFGHAYLGDGASGVYAWGLMVEANTTLPGKYIDNPVSTIPGPLDTTGSNIIYTWDGSYWLSAQLKELNDLANDNILTPAEKISIIKERDIILQEQIALTAQATFYTNLPDELADYTDAVDDLLTYLATLTTPYIWTDLTQGHNTNIDGTLFKNAFVTYYTAKDTFVNVLNTEASIRASWDYVVGTERPEDSANNIGVSSETIPAGGISLVSALDTVNKVYKLRSLISKSKGFDISLSSDAKTIELESHSLERDHIALSTDFYSSTAVLADVPGMELYVDVNSVYYISGVILVYSADAGAGILLGMSGPAGTTIDLYPTTGSAPLGQVYPYAIHAMVSTSGTAGLVKLRFSSEDTNTVVLKQNSLLILNQVLNMTPPGSGGYVIDSSTSSLASAYTSGQYSTVSGASATLNITVKTDGSIAITIGDGDTLTVGSPTTDLWALGVGNNPQSFEVKFTADTLVNNPTVSNGAAVYTKLDADRIISITKSCSYGSSAIASATVDISVRKIGTTSPAYTKNNIVVTIDVESANVGGGGIPP